MYINLINLINWTWLRIVAKRFVLFPKIIVHLNISLFKKKKLESKLRFERTLFSRCGIIRVSDNNWFVRVSTRRNTRSVATYALGSDSKKRKPNVFQHFLRKNSKELMSCNKTVWKQCVWIWLSISFFDQNWVWRNFNLKITDQSYDVEIAFDRAGLVGKKKNWIRIVFRFGTIIGRLRLLFMRIVLYLTLRREIISFRLSNLMWQNFWRRLRFCITS